MIGYKKYRVTSNIGNQECDTFETAISCKDSIIKEISDGLHDDKADNLWATLMDASSVEEQRNTAIDSLRLFEVHYTPSGQEKNIIPINNDGGRRENAPKLTITIDHDKKPYNVDMRRIDKLLYVPGGMICNICPWGALKIPLTLSICICPDGDILHRGWSWSNDTNYYLQTNTKSEDVSVTPEMLDTVAGLFSGRITVDDLVIPVGKTVQEICPIDVSAEEKKIGKKIYLR